MATLDLDAPCRDSRVLFNWQVSSYFGWGVYGLNLLLAWADRTDLLPATVSPLIGNMIDIDPLELRRISPALQRSLAIQTELKSAGGHVVTSPTLVLEALQNGLDPLPAAHNVVLR